MNVQIRPFQKEDTAAILEIINYNILHATSLYDYSPRSLEQQAAILEEKLKNFDFPLLCKSSPAGIRCLPGYRIQVC